MLKSKKLPDNINCKFLILNNKKVLIFTSENFIPQLNIYIVLPLYIKIKKHNNNLNFSLIKQTNFKEFNGFMAYFDSLLYGFRLPLKKTLLLRGLGLKGTLVNNVLQLKLGYSHLIYVNVNTKVFNFILGKNFISIFCYNKGLVGNFVKNLYKLKKADPYKGRGLVLKSKPIILKIIKKS
jgi:large subunit ribosomal protein L6